MSTCQATAGSLRFAFSREQGRTTAPGVGNRDRCKRCSRAWESGILLPSPRGLAPLDYLQPMSKLPRSLIIHGNFLTAAEIKFLGQQADRMSLIYCPRTYSHFHDMRLILSQPCSSRVWSLPWGLIPVPPIQILSLLAEMQHVAQAHPTIAPELIVQMGTRHGAQALGLTKLCGTIEPGKRANLITVCSDPGNSASVAEAVMARREVVCRASWVVDSGSLSPKTTADMQVICQPRLLSWPLPIFLTRPGRSWYRRSLPNQQPPAALFADTRSDCETRFPVVERIAGFES